MSLWGATVITNMLSAIPWIGGDFVELKIILLFKLRLFTYILHTYSGLPTVGIVNTKALRGKKSRTIEDKKSYLNVPFDFLRMFVGFVDGDGYFQVTNSGKGSIRLNLVISLELRDLELLEYFKKTLGGIGRINTYPKINTAKYIIGRVDLQEVLIPLLLHHQLFFLTETRRKQFDLVMHILLNNITRFSDIPEDTSENFPLPSTALGYLQLPFFLKWIVGFTMAEGSFYIKTSGEFVFSLRQRSHDLLFQGIKLVFKTNTKIENLGGYMKLSVSSVKDLTTVVELFSYSGLHPLRGLKSSDYKKWADRMKRVPRFKNLKLPE